MARPPPRRYFRRHRSYRPRPVGARRCPARPRPTRPSARPHRSRARPRSATRVAARRRARRAGPRTIRRPRSRSASATPKLVRHRRSGSADRHRQGVVAALPRPYARAASAARRPTRRARAARSAPRTRACGRSIWSARSRPFVRCEIPVSLISRSQQQLVFQLQTELQSMHQDLQHCQYEVRPRTAGRG